ncbi:general secretion pathway protein GspN [Pseudomonas cichorii]|uniref:general secretion pathway protein GspN n=1 Tax=Pseudomonas cichorii TaxID=36746 RepID=UPI000F004D05|nr:general secretion pathway protein GspN [Pseudomonas cichorii]
MKRRLWAVGALVFALTLALNAPAAFLARFVNWAPDWQPQGIQGTLWRGQMQRLGAIGPLRWDIRPWSGQAQVNAGFQQQGWELNAQGWPWAWRAELMPVTGRVTPATGYVLDGRWQGRLLIQGRGATCMSSQGELSGKDLALLSPWMVLLGNAQLRLECRGGLKLLAEVRRDAEHRFEIGLEPAMSRIKLSGQVEPEAMVTPVLVQAGLLKPGASQFETVLGKR